VQLSQVCGCLVGRLLTKCSFNCKMSSFFGQSLVSIISIIPMRLETSVLNFLCDPLNSGKSTVCATGGDNQRLVGEKQGKKEKEREGERERKRERKGKGNH
jgi:hypothetical protein